MFKLAQLLIEYLLHSQEYLQGYINQTDAQMQKFVQVGQCSSKFFLNLFNYLLPKFRSIKYFLRSKAQFQELVRVVVNTIVMVLILTIS